MADGAGEADGDLGAGGSGFGVSWLSGAARVTLTAVNRIAAEVAGLALRRPVSVSIRPSVSGLFAGRVDEVTVSVSGVMTSGLIVDRLDTTGRGVRIRPGLPPRIQADQVIVTGQITEESAAAWLTPLGGPFRVRLSEEGVGLRTQLGTLKVSEVLAEITVEGRFLRLRPRSASMLGIGTRLPDAIAGALPLPPLPNDATLTGVSHGEGWVEVTLDLGPADQPLDAGLPDRLRRRFRLGG